MPEVLMLYSTFANRDEAIFVAEQLLEKRLIACANIHECDSLYRWEGEIKREKEAVLTAKLPAAKKTAVIAEVTRLHSYSLPCIVVTTLADGLLNYLQWVIDEAL